MYNEIIGRKRRYIMKKTLILMFIVFLLSIGAASAQTIETISPYNIGNYFTWDHTDLEIAVILMNINLADSSFSIGKLPLDVPDTIYVGGYEDDTVSHGYTFMIDGETGLLKSVEYTQTIKDNSMIIPTMEKIRDAYGLAEAKPYYSDAFTPVIKLYEHYLMAAQGPTVAVLGYSMGKDGSPGIVDLSFWARSYYEKGVG